MLLEADAQAESNWARTPNHQSRPSDWRQCYESMGPSYWARAHIHWGGPVIGTHSTVWAGHMAQVLHSWNNSKTAPILKNKTAPFSQNEIAPFFQHPVISKITYLIN